MKVISFLKSLLLVASISFVLFSCSNDDSNKADEEIKENELAVGKVSVFVDQAYISQKFNVEDGEGTLGAGFYIGIMEDGIFVQDMGSYDVFDGDGYGLLISLVSTGSAELLPGTYSFQTENQVFPFISFGRLSLVVNGSPEELGTISDGTVTVTKSGLVYTIDLNLTVNGTVTVKGYYEGELEAVTLLL